MLAWPRHCAIKGANVDVLPIRVGIRWQGSGRLQIPNPLVFWSWQWTASHLERYREDYRLRPNRVGRPISGQPPQAPAGTRRTGGAHRAQPQPPAPAVLALGRSYPQALPRVSYRPTRQEVARQLRVRALGSVRVRPLGSGPAPRSLRDGGGRDAGRVPERRRGTHHRPWNGRVPVRTGFRSLDGSGHLPDRLRERGESRSREGSTAADMEKRDADGGPARGPVARARRLRGSLRSGCWSADGACARNQLPARGVARPPADTPRGSDDLRASGRRSLQRQGRASHR